MCFELRRTGGLERGFYDGQLEMQGGFRIWRSGPNRLRRVGVGTKDIDVHMETRRPDVF